MPAKTLHSRVLIIAGMHRSGTSLLASWLEQCGLPIGDELVPGGIGNPLGHFEDKAFIDFHQSVLRDNHLDTLVIDQEIELSEAHYQFAMLMAAQRSDQAQWGWKDPRTCLFLDFWKDVIPDAYALCIFRHPAEVIDSFRRRAILKQQEAESKTDVRSGGKAKPVSLRVRDRITRWNTQRRRVKLVALYVNAWIRQNQEILRLVEEHPADTLLIHASDLQNYSELLADFLIESWGFELEMFDFEQVYQSSMMKQSMNIFFKLAVLILAPSSVQTYRQLLHYREESIGRITKLPPRPHLGLLIKKPQRRAHPLTTAPNHLHFSRPKAG